MPAPSNNPIRKPIGPAAATRSHLASTSDQLEQVSENRGTTPLSTEHVASVTPSTCTLYPSSTPSDTYSTDDDSDTDTMSGTPEKFDGLVDPTDWLDDITAYSSMKKWDDVQAAGHARFLFQAKGSIWYKTLPPDTRTSFKKLTTSFEAYWIEGPNRPDLGQQLRTLATSKQKPGQSVPDYVLEVLAMSKHLSLNNAIIMTLIESGLRPEVLPFFRQAKPATPQDVIACEALQDTSSSSSTADVSLLQAIDDMLQP